MTGPLIPLIPLSPLADFSGKVEQVASDVATGAANVATGGMYSAVSDFFSYNNVAILVGLLLVAAGLFSIRQVREYTGYAAKTAALAA
jgi:hypothetical protein